MRKVRGLAVMASLALVTLFYQNCSNMESFQIGSTEESSSLGTNDECLLGQTQTGFAVSSSVYPNLCGGQVTRRCVNGAWQGPEVFPSCQQSCLDPKSNEPVPAGTSLISFSVASATTQAACDSARVTSMCDTSTGRFLPALQSNSSCLVAGQTCAYSNAPGRAVATGNQMGATVTGFIASTAVYPNLCGNQVTRTCQSSSAWSGSTPLYTSCAQSCLHPDTNSPVSAGTSYGAYFTRNSGTQAECDAARVTAAASSTCSASTGQFSPALPNNRYASCAVSQPPPSSPGTPLNSARIFFSGHSLMNYPIPPLTESIANSRNTPARHNLQQVGGSSIRHRSRGDSPEGSTQFIGYSRGINREGQNMNIINEFLTGSTIGGDRYDTLVITERHDLITAMFYDNTVKYLRHYHERFRAGNMNGQTYFYHPWLSMVKTKPQEWLNYEREAAKGWTCVATRINHSLAAEGRTDRIRNLPAAAALAHLVERALNGNVPGITGANSMATLNTLISDDVHLTTVGSYYLAAVVYASIYRRSPVGAAGDPGVTAVQANSLQTIAWEFISNYYTNYTEPTLAQCQALAPDLCNAFWNYDWLYANNPSRIAGCRNDFVQQNQTNPFYYNRSTDASYWLPAPQ